MKTNHEKSIEISPQECLERRRKPFAPALIDVRTREEQLQGGLPGSKTLDASQWSIYFEELSPLKWVLFYDELGDGRAVKAAHWLREQGFKNACAVSGGWQALKTALAQDGETLSQIPFDQWLPKLEALFDKEIRPILQSDGGDAKIETVTEKTLTIRYLGACASCSGGQEGTLKLISGFIENYFNHQFEMRFV